MKAEFKDTFFESVEKLVWYDTKLWKVWEVVRYSIPRFIRNIILFRKALWNYRWWDHTYMLYFMETGLKDMANKLEEQGREVDISRFKKVDKMLRAAKIIDNIIKDNYIPIAESELGKMVHHEIEFERVEGKPEYYRMIDKDTPEEREHRKKVFDRSQEIEEQEWKELWRIFEGQDSNEYKEFLKQHSPEEQGKRDLWNDWFDGTGMRGWWD